MKSKEQYKSFSDVPLPAFTNTPRPPDIPAPTSSERAAADEFREMMTRRHSTPFISNLPPVRWGLNE